jgi:hypothetical protein
MGEACWGKELRKGIEMKEVMLGERDERRDRGRGLPEYYYILGWGRR